MAETREAAVGVVGLTSLTLGGGYDGAREARRRRVVITTHPVDVVVDPFVPVS